ncbi:hypothetical protein PVT71_01785 [Salipiger sp. H15]|uniref:Uncharacterized protein n=1 Tax=Alloyangia sp. H15 TaxID=3029062 RepID=A0AAU8AH84_9RHOB
MAGIFFLGGWAWFAYVQGRGAEPYGALGSHEGLTGKTLAAMLPMGGGDTAEAYARKVFGGLLPIDTVLASKITASSEDGAPSCSYAIVRTGTGIARTPPTSALGTAWWERYGGEWRQTPERLFGALPIDVLALCEAEWKAGLGDELQQALDAPGNWYMRSATGEDLQIFSAEGRLAARIRNGS